MTKLFKWLLLVIAGIGLGITLLLYNPGLFKDPLENYLSKLTGYSISIDGDLQVSAGRQLEISATHIRIANPERNRDSQLVELGQLVLVLDSASLLSDTIHISSLRTNDLNIYAKTDTEGVSNWTTVGSQQQPPEPPGDHGPRVMIEDIGFNNTRVHYLNASTGIQHDLAISSLSQQQDTGGELALSFDGTLNTWPLAFTGHLGPLKNIIAGRNIAFQGSGHFGALDISGEGLIDNLSQPRQPALDIRLSGQDIDAVTSMLGADDLGAGAFTLNITGGIVNGRYVAGVHGNIGAANLNVSLLSSDLSQHRELNLDLAVNGPNLGALTRAFGIQNWPDQPFSLKGQALRTGSVLTLSALTMDIGTTRVSLDASLPAFPSLDASRVDFTVRGDDIEYFRDLLGIPGIANGSFELRGSLRLSDDDVEHFQIEASTSVVAGTLTGTLGPSPDYIGSKLNLQLEGRDARQFFSIFSTNDLPSDPFDLDARIEVTAAGLRFEQVVIKTSAGDRLELSGLLAPGPDKQNSEFQLALSGQNLARAARGLAPGIDIPPRAYTLKGRIRMRDDGLELDNLNARFESVHLAVNGFLSTQAQLEGTSLKFQISGSDLADLSNFPAIGSSVAVFVPGQAYELAGRLRLWNNRLLLEESSGRIGETAIEVSGEAVPPPGSGSFSVRFSLQGPEFDRFLRMPGTAEFAAGPFSSSGDLKLDGDRLALSGFRFETDKAQVRVAMQMRWPVSAGRDINFDIDVRGDDVRYLFPPELAFQPARAAFSLRALGQRKGDFVSLQKFEAGFGNLLVMLQGRLGDNADTDSTSITVNVTTTDISTLGHINGASLPAEAFDLQTEAYGNASELQLRNFSAVLGDNQVTGSAHVSLRAARPVVTMTINSDHLDLQPLLAWSDTETQEKPDTGTDRLIPATPLPLDMLSAADVTLAMDIGLLQHPLGDFKNLLVRAKTRDGNFDLDKLSFDGPKGQVSTSLSILPTSGDLADVKIDLVARQLALGPTRQAGNEPDKLPVYDIVLHASSSGRDLRELAGAMNGTLYAGSDGGVLEGVSLSILDTFFLEEVFKLVTPQTDTSNSLEASCAASIVKFTDGLMETYPALALTTSQIALISRGTLDLKTEQLRFHFKATPNNALKISAGELFNPYIAVGGTLSKPTVGLDPAKVLLHGGVAIGTAGISILARGLANRVGNAEPLCEEMLETVRQKLSAE